MLLKEYIDDPTREWTSLPSRHLGGLTTRCVIASRAAPSGLDARIGKLDVSSNPGSNDRSRHNHSHECNQGKQLSKLGARSRLFSVFKQFSARCYGPAPGD